MGNIHNTTDMNLPPHENNVQYPKWIDDIYKEIRDVYLKTTEHHINVLKLLDKFLEKFRQYIQEKEECKSRMHDYHLVRETNRLMFLIRDLFSDRNNRNYLMKASEILGGCTFLWLRYHSLEDEQYNETHIETILNCYAIHLQSTTDESFLLKIITHTLYECKRLPKIFYKILEMHLKRRVQRKVRQNLEVKEDQLYILYIIAFKLWDNLQPDGGNKINIAKYANSYMKPMTSLLSNIRYVPNLPKITSEDVKCGRATRIVINNLLPSKLLKLAEAVVKEDWLSGINTPITVDLCIDDDVNRSEEVVESDRTCISVNTEIRNLSLGEKQSNILSKELWWVKVLQKQALKNINRNRTNYRLVEVIDLDDEDVNNCDSTSKTNMGMEVRKKVDSAKRISCTFPKEQKQQSDTIQKKENNSITKFVGKNTLKAFEVRDSSEANPFDRLTSIKKEVDVAMSTPHVEILNIESQSTQELSNEFKSNKEKSHPNKLEEIEKNQMASMSKIIIQETGRSKELEQIKQPTIESKHEHTVENLISKKTNQVTKQNILPKMDGSNKNENLPTSNVKRKAVSFAKITQNKPPHIINRNSNSDPKLFERKTCESPLTIQNEPQNWRSSINNSPPLSNQHDRASSQEQDQEFELLSTSDVNSLGSSSPPPMKESGMTQNMFQFENDTQLSVFNDDAVGNNTEVLPNKSCESDNNLVSATDLSASSSTLKVKTDLMSSDSELNNAEEDSINMIWQLITEHCDSKPDEKKIQNSLPLKKRRKLSRDGSSFVEVNCKESSDKKTFEYYDKQIAYPAERCMSILQFLDISQCQTTFFVNNNSSIAIINNSPSQQTILTGGNGFNVISQQQKGSPSTTNANVYPNIPVQRDMNEEIPATENINGNVFQCSKPSSKQNNFERPYNGCNLSSSNGEAQSELNNFDYKLNSNYPAQTTQSNINHKPIDATLDLSNLNYNVNSNKVESRGSIGQNNISVVDINKFKYSQNSVNANPGTQNNILETTLHKEKYNSPNNTNFIQENQQRNNLYLQSSNEVNKVGWQQMTDVPDSYQQKSIVQNPQLGNDGQKFNYPNNIDIAAQNQQENSMQRASTEMNDYRSFSLHQNIPVSGIQNIIQNIQQKQRVNNFNCSLNANIESQRAIAQSMQNSDQKSNTLGNINENIDHLMPLNMNQMQSSMNENFFQYDNQDRVENQKNETPQSELNLQDRDIPESNGENNLMGARLSSIEDAQKLGKQQLFGVNMDHYNLKYEHISNYFHNNQINFAKKRALLHDEEEHCMFWNKEGDHGSEKYENSKKQPKLKKKCEESRGKSRKSKNLTSRLTRSSNRTLPVNYKDDGLAERKSRKQKSSSIQSKA